MCAAKNSAWREGDVHMKRKMLIACSLVAMIGAGLLGLFVAIKWWQPSIDDIIYEKHYTIQNQERFDFTLSVPVSALTEAIYSAEGQTFAKNDAIAFQTETTSIYLKKAMVSNESDALLYFIFDFAYDLPSSGTLLVPYQKVGRAYRDYLGLSNDDTTDDEIVYPDTVSLRGYGPSKQFTFYVAADVCKSAVGTLKFDVFCNEIAYSSITK
jgi:hypothetical protein